MRSSAYDAIIVGAGIIGCSIAYALSRRGYRTLNIDRMPAAGYGSTSASSAVIRPFYPSVDSTLLAFESHHQWLKWAEFLRKPAEHYARYVQCGCLILDTPSGQYLRHVRRVLEKADIPFENWTAARIEQRLPGIAMDSFAPPKRIDHPRFGETNGGKLTDGLFCPTAGYVNDPQLACRNLAEAATAAGAAFAFNQAVTQVATRAGSVSGVTLAGGAEVRAPIVVNAAGPHSAQVNALAGMHLGAMATRALRQEVAHVRTAGHGHSEAMAMVVVDLDTGVYLRPEIGGHILVGSLEPDCDELLWVDADDADPSFSEQWTNQVWRAAQRFPELVIPSRASGVVGLYDVTRDWTPIYDKSDLNGYYMAIGTSGNQFKNAPVVGDLMASLIEACEAGHDHDADPVQFHLSSLQKEIGLGTFSRLRSPAVGTESVLG